MSLQRLVVDGGEPEFPEQLHVGRPNLPERDRFMALLDGVLERRWLTNFGPLVKEFETRVAEVSGFAHAVATCNGTIGLEIATRALGLNTEAIVPSWTFVATPHALRWQEIRPVFADVTRHTHHLDADSVRRVMTPSVSGIVAVALWGSRLDLAQLRSVADEHGIPIVVDAAHAFATRGVTSGTRLHGDAEILSFHATKFLNTFEGGAILTDNPDLADQVRRMTNFGFAGRDRVEAIGINGKMSEVAAAMGLAALDQLPRLLEVNRRNFEAYREGMRYLPGVRLVEPNSPTHNHQYVVVTVDESVCGMSRDALVEALSAENVDARRYFAPGTHRMMPYREEQPNAGLVLPVTEELATTTMVLPTGSAMTTDAVQRVARLLGCLVERARSGPAVDHDRVPQLPARQAAA